MTISLTAEELTAFKSKCDGWNMEYTGWLLEQFKTLGTSVNGPNVIEMRQRVTEWREKHPFPTLVKI